MDPQAKLRVEAAVRMFQKDAGACTACRGLRLIHHDGDVWSRPLFDRYPMCLSKVVVVGEAPNSEDTFSPDKGYLTYDIETDPTGNFTRELLQSVGLQTTDVLFTNAVLCLPAARAGRYPVTTKQMKVCSSWLRRLILDAEARVVITLGARPLAATRLIEEHGITRLKGRSGAPLAWFGRMLLPLYHPGRLGRVSRSAADQLSDISVLGTLLA